MSDQKNNLYRCEWAVNGDINYIKYHDDEWGVPVHDDQVLFEFLTLEGAQAGLSWKTVLDKRSGYHSAFLDFDIQLVASLSDTVLEELRSNPAIIRNKLKIESTRSNAQAFLLVQETLGSFDEYLWGFTDGSVVQNAWKKMSDVPASTPLSDKIAKDLKKRGFRFVGTTIIYAFLQAVGVVNDHTTDCFRYSELSK